MFKVIVIAGVTASGKSRLAVDLADLFNGEIISADAYQVYKGMDIGTNKTSLANRKEVAHHLIDCVTVDEPWDVSIFQTRARRLIDDIVARKKTPIVCGGTGFYINALLNDYRFLPLVEKRDYSSFTNEELHKLLVKVDDAEAAKIPANNRRRVEKALDFIKGHGIRKSVHDQGQNTLLYDALILFLDPPKSAIAPLIEKRVVAMLAGGWAEEAKSLFEQYPSFAHSIAAKAIGYQAVLTGNLDPATISAEVLEYSRKQRTWFVNKQRPNTHILHETYGTELMAKCVPLVASFLDKRPCA